MQASTSTAVEQTGLSGARDYALKSDLAQFCLPAANRDANRKLAYVNSICFSFLVIGIVGMKNPVQFKKALPPVVELMPVELLTPPPEQQVQPEPKPDELEPPPDTVVEMPQIATVVASDPSQVNFAVPVEGPVVFAPAQFAQAPPAVPPKPTGRTVQKFNGTDGGIYPELKYPPAALQQRQQGDVLTIITVNPDGSVESVEVSKGSGHSILDRAVVQWVKTRFKFPPIGTQAMRYYEKPFEFHLR